MTKLEELDAAYDAAITVYWVDGEFAAVSAAFEAYYSELNKSKEQTNDAD